MKDLQDNPFEVPLPPDPLREDFPEAEAYAFTPGETVEDTLTVDHGGREVSITMTVTGDPEYPTVTGGTEPEVEASLPHILWTAVWWAHALGVPHVASIRVHTWEAVTPTFQIGGLYRYADFPLTEEETA